MWDYKFSFSIIFFWIPILSFSAVEADFQGSGTLTIQSSGFKNEKGNAKLQIFDRAEDFLKNPIEEKNSPIKAGKASWTIKDLPYGNYALLVFHDENKNQKLDRKTLGNLQEAYGFSNEARELSGPPTFADALFTFAPETPSVDIQVK